MKIIADNQLAFLTDFFADAGDLVAVPGREITQAHVRDADVLLVRSITQVNEQLLAHSTVKYVFSATSGSDHIDHHYLRTQPIFSYVAIGCNAMAVTNYVLFCIAYLQQQQLLKKKNITAAVIGCGHVGRCVVDMLQQLGIRVLQYDPPRELIDKNFQSDPFDLIATADLVLLHVSLTTTGAYPTAHLVAKNFLTRLKPGAILLNAARGAVINDDDLKRWGHHIHWCMDVYEHEPIIDSEILSRAIIATPHIAGYTIESKYRATKMIYDAFCQVCNRQPQDKRLAFAPTVVSLPESLTTWQEALLHVYNPWVETQQLKQVLLGTTTPVAAFDQLRARHRERRELSQLIFTQSSLSDEDDKILRQLTARSLLF